MFRFLFGLLVASIYGLHATIFDPGIEAATEGDPFGSLCDCVSPITGDFTANSEDIVIRGFKPLRIHRTYVSGNGKGEFGGWSYFSHLELQTFKEVQKKKTVQKASVYDVKGTKLTFKKQNKDLKKNALTTYRIDFKDYGKGITNTSRGSISGRTNLKNFALYQEKENQYILDCPDGTKRYYEHPKKRKESKGAVFYRLTKEQHPDGHLTVYEYDNRDRISIIYNRPPYVPHTYAWCKFHYRRAEKKGKLLVLETSDGRELTYHFICKGKSDNNPRYFLQSVHSPELPEETIYYTKKTEKTDHLVLARCLPEGRKVAVEYYEFNKVYTIGDQTITMPGPYSRNCGRVHAIRQSQGESIDPITTHSFIYHPIENGEGYTEIYDAQYNRATLHFNNRYLPTDVCFYEDGIKKKILHTEWDDQGKIREKNIQSEDTTVLTKSYDYDDQGNVLVERISATITQDNSADTITTRSEYDRLNRLTYREEPSGLKTYYKYLYNTNLLQAKLVTDGENIHLREFNHYDANNIITEQITDDGTSEKRDDLTSVTMRTIRRFHRIEFGPNLHYPHTIEEFTQNPLTGQEQLLSKTCFQYDQLCNITQKESYDSNDTFQFSIFYEYDEKGRLIKEIKPQNQITSYEYDINNNPITQIDPSGKITRIIYDIGNRPIREEESTPEGHGRITQYQYNEKNQKILTIDPLGNETRYAYDRFDNLIHIIHPNGASEHFSYNILGHQTHYTDPLGHTTQTTPNILGKPLHILHPDQTTETFRYNLDGTLQSHTDQNKNIKRFTYDALGRENKIEYLDSHSNLLATETFIYSSTALLKYIDRQGIATTYEYDSTGRKTAMQRANSRTEYSYDTLSRLYEEKHCNGSNSLTTRNEYNQLNQLIRQTQLDTSNQILDVTEFTYDQSGNQTAIIKPHTRQTTQYDTFKRPILQQDGEGNQTIIAYDEYHLNPEGQRVLRTVTTDPNHIRTIDTFDPLLHLTKRTILDPQNTILFQEEYTYDLNGNCTQQHCHRYANGQYLNTTTITKSYDSQNRLTKLIEATNTPEQRTTHYTYTPKGLLHQTIKPDQTTLTYTYDPFDNLIDLKSSDQTIHYTYQYNRNNQLLQSNDHINNTTTKRTYDQNGNLTSEILANNLTISYTYDQLGRPTTLKLPHQTITYTYNPLHLTQVSLPNHSISYTYNQSSQLTSRSDTTYTYDRSGRPTNLQSPHFTQTLHYDPCGNIIQALKQDIPLDYKYDNLGQLIRERNNTYAYDSYYNRLTHNDTTYQVNNLHALDAYTYDPNGNPIQKGDTTLRYDALDRLIQVITPTQTIHYTYDSFHRRLTKTTPHTTEKYLYNGMRELGTPTHYRICGHSERDTLLIIKNNTPYQVTQDLQGNIVQLASPTETYTHTYSTFAEENPMPSPSPWRYSAKRYDPETNLLYFGYRYYDPETGRWLTPDPSALTDSPNLYAYTYNNPFLYLDAYGLSSEISAFPIVSPLPDGQQKLHFDYFEDNIHMQKNSGDDFYYNYSREYYLKPDGSCVPEFGDPFSAKSFPWPNEPPDRMIMHVNGIMSDYPKAIENARYIQSFTNSQPVCGVHTATYGFANDIDRSLAGFKNVATEPVKLMHRMFDRYFQNAAENATLLLILHSRSTIDGKLALYTYDQEKRKRIFVIAIAPAAFIDPGICGGVRHYLSRDIVPIFDRVGRKKHAHTIQHLTPHRDAPFNDHELQSPTYEEPLRTDITRYFKTGII